MSQQSFVLSRRVPRSPVPAERALLTLPRGDYAGLTLVSAFERRTIVGPWGSGPPERHAVAELAVGRGRPERVEVELGAWARDAVELRVRPETHRPDRWSPRRRERYFVRAHEAIDALARTLEHETPAPAARHPITRTA